METIIEEVSSTTSAIRKQIPDEQKGEAKRVKVWLSGLQALLTLRP